MIWFWIYWNHGSLGVLKMQTALPDQNDEVLANGQQGSRLPKSVQDVSEGQMTKQASHAAG